MSAEPSPPSRAGRAGPFGPATALRVATYVVLLGASTGALWALWGALGVIRSHGYAELGFTRSAALVLEEASDRGAFGGARLTAILSLSVLAVLLLFRDVRELLHPPALLALLADPLRLLQAQVICALLAAGAMLALAATEAVSARAGFLLLGLIGGIAWLCLEALARYVRAVGDMRHARLQADVAGACAAILPVLLLAYPLNRRRVYFPFAAETWLVNGLLLAGAALVFFLVRRHVLATRRSVGATRLPGWARALLVLLILPALAPLFVRAFAQMQGGPALAAAQPWNVVIVGVDTLRADRTMLTPPAAGERDLTPNLRALAERGVVFSRAISQAPWTMPAFASILTGKYPMQHGAISLTGRLRNREVTLAEVLREANYATGSFVSHDYTDAKHGFAQGNDEFSDEFALGHDEITSQGITDQAIDFVARHGSRPFFLFAHYFDPHYEYRNHADWDFADGYSGWLSKQLDFENLVKNRQLLEAPEIEYLRDLYDEEIAYTDREIGRLVDALEERQLMSRTVFILCADHGEEFLEHGNVGHTTSLYDELLHVPLVVVAPAMAEAHTVVTRTVETRQVFSTVIEALGIDYGYNSRPRSLLAPASAGGGARLEPQPAFSMLWLPDAKPAWGKQFEIVSLQDDQWKLIHDLTRGRYLLFDLAADPQEQRDLSDSDAQRFAKLRVALDAWLAEMQLADKDVPRGELDDETRIRLRKLGYM